MAKRWFGYVDLRSNGLIRTRGLGEFDTTDLNQTDWLALENWEGDDDIDGETLMESVVPTKIHFLIDNLDQAYKKRFITSEDEIDYYTDWPVELRDVFKTYEKAKKEIYKQKQFVFRGLFSR